MFCTKCGNEIEVGARFCTRCGNPVSAPPEPPRDPAYSETASGGPKKKGPGEVLMLILMIVLAALIVLGTVFAVLLLRSRGASHKEEYALEEEDDSSDSEDEGPSRRRRVSDTDESAEQEDKDTREGEVRETPAEEADDMETVRLDDAGGDGAYGSDAYDGYDQWDTEPAEEASDDEDDFYSGMIFQDSDRRYLEEEELESLSEEELKLARNEIYARRGRRFRDPELQRYYDGCEWYEQLVDPDDFNENILNDYEMYNRDLIIKYEKKKGYR